MNLDERLDTQARRMEIEGATLWRANPFVRGGAHRPGILLFVVESYGDVLFTDPAFASFPAWLQYKPAYRQSIDYALLTIESYLQRLPADDRSLIIVLGDHQPRRPVASMKKSPWWVPIHVLSRDPGAVDRFGRVGYLPGIIPGRPGPRQAVVPMERFVSELFTAYGARGR